MGFADFIYILTPEMLIPLVAVCVTIVPVFSFGPGAKCGAGVDNTCVRGQASNWTTVRSATEVTRLRQVNQNIFAPCLHRLLTFNPLIPTAMQLTHVHSACTPTLTPTALHGAGCACVKMRLRASRHTCATNLPRPSEGRRDVSLKKRSRNDPARLAFRMGGRASCLAT